MQRATDTNGNQISVGYYGTIVTKALPATNMKGLRIKVSYNANYASRIYGYHRCCDYATELGFRGESGIHAAAVMLYLHDSNITGTNWMEGRLGDINSYVFIEV